MCRPSQGEFARGDGTTAGAGEREELYDWLEEDPDYRALTSASGRMLHASALLPQANAVALTITAQADLVRLLEDAEHAGVEITAWQDDAPRGVVLIDGTWTVQRRVDGAVPTGPSPSTLRDRTAAVAPESRVLAWARRETMGADAPDELHARLFPLSVADLADQLITVIEHDSVGVEAPWAASLSAQWQSFPVRATRSAPGLFAPEPLDAGGRLSAWRAGKAVAAAQDALEDCAVVLTERWGTRLLISDERHAMTGDAHEIGAVALGHPDAHQLGDWLEVTTGELTAGAGQLVILGHRPEESHPWRLITAQHGAVEIIDFAITPSTGNHSPAARSMRPTTRSGV